MSDDRMKSQVAVAGLVLVLVVALMGAVGILAAVLDEEYRLFTKEPIETFGARPYVGVVAHVTVLIWAAGATCAALAALLLRRLHVSLPMAGFLAGAAAISALLLADDFFLAHELIYPHAGIPEEAVYLFYAAAFATLIWRFREEVRRAGALLPLLAAACWALSIGFDMLQEWGGVHLHVLEDGAKLLGTALWCTFLARTAWSELLAAAENVGLRHASSSPES